MSAVQVDRNGLEVLEADECVRLLTTATVGRIGVSSDALPVVLPVNFRVDGGQILFRTGRGTKLDAATHNAVVAFEVDDFDAVSHTGWSVIVTGVAHEVSDLPETDLLRLPRWAPGGNGRVVAVSMELISGRRILPGGSQPEDEDEHG